VRYIFYSIIAANLILAAWQLVQPRDDNRAPDTIAPKWSDSVPPIQLYSEAPELALARNVEAGLAAGLNAADQGLERVEKESDDSREELLCVSLGPFVSLMESNDLISELSDMGFESLVRRELKPLDTVIWAYLEPFGSIASALNSIARLREIGINASLIVEGELTNGLSLGLHASQQELEAKITKIIHLDLVVKTEETPKNSEEMWAVVLPTDGKELTNEIFSNFSRRYPSIRLVQKVCKPIASPP